MRKSSLGAVFAFGLLCAVTGAESAPLIQGTASVIDGDTIEIHGERIRFDAIDAPESSQLCLDAAGKRYRCGQKSAFALADMIGRSVVQEDEARLARRGVWAGSFEMPWDWRARNR